MQMLKKKKTFLFFRRVYFITPPKQKDQKTVRPVCLEDVLDFIKKQLGSSFLILFHHKLQDNNMKYKISALFAV